MLFKTGAQGYLGRQRPVQRMTQLQPNSPRTRCGYLILI